MIADGGRNLGQAHLLAPRLRKPWGSTAAGRVSAALGEVAWRGSMAAEAAWQCGTKRGRR